MHKKCAYGSGAVVWWLYSLGLPLTTGFFYEVAPIPIITVGMTFFP